MSDIENEVLHQLIADISAEDLNAVLTAFKADMISLSAAIKAAVAARDMAGFRHAAHCIAGSAASVGAAALARAARRAMVAASAEMAAADEIAGLTARALLGLGVSLAEGARRA